MRHRRFAHAHRADVLGFDELDRDREFERARQRRRGHPAGGSASHDDDALEPRFVAHEPIVAPIAALTA